MDFIKRTELLLGKEKVKSLMNKCVAIIGLGGVGSYTAEALVRCGIGNIYIVDHDMISTTNLNRQIHALSSTIGESKVKIMFHRLKDINPSIRIQTHKIFIDEENINTVLNKDIDYIVDAVDIVNSKISIIKYAIGNNIPIISSMGAGNRLDPMKFRISNIWQTKYCPLAKSIRKMLRKEKINQDIKVIFSEEKPIKFKNTSNQNKIIGSISFVTSTAGLLIASEVIKDL